MIRQFDVFPSPVRSERAERPYVLVLQHKIFSAANSRALASLVVSNDSTFPERAMPGLRVRGRLYYLLATDLFTLPTKYLHTAVANLESDRDRIIAALDLVFTGI